ncbi:uncharacterized protein [Antedon mediterranea]|uniref:uncharacterized protein n=1 Tax=Antedon mediterranea TaxID=105859 RepID=UPI003AF4B5E1
MDIWEEDLDTPSNWDKMTNERFKFGYAEGVVKGEQEAVQEGFNAGFNQASIHGLYQGFLKGILSAVSTSDQLYGSSPFESDSKVATLIEKANQHLEQIKQLKTKEKTINKQDRSEIVNQNNESSIDLSGDNVCTCLKKHTKGENHESCLDDQTSSDGEICSCLLKQANERKVNTQPEIDLAKSILGAIGIEESELPVFIK